MKARKYYVFPALGVVLIALATVFPPKRASAHTPT
jgi:hypothetical protein